MAERFNLDRVQRAIGSQPSFHESPAVDALTDMVIALVGEVALLRDRLDAHERLSGAHGGFGPRQVDAFKADGEAAPQRQAARDAIYDRVLGAGVDKLAPDRLKREQARYDQVLTDVSAR